MQASIGSLINNQQLQDADAGAIAPEAKKKNTTANIGMSIIRKVIPGGKVRGVILFFLVLVLLIFVLVRVIASLEVSPAPKRRA